MDIRNYFVINVDSDPITGDKVLKYRLKISGVSNIVKIYESKLKPNFSKVFTEKKVHKIDIDFDDKFKSFFQDSNGEDQFIYYCYNEDLTVNTLIRILDDEDEEITSPKSFDVSNDEIDRKYGEKEALGIYQELARQRYWYDWEYVDFNLNPDPHLYCIGLRFQYN